MGLPKNFATTDFSLAVTLLTLGIRPLNQRMEPAQKGDQIEWREIPTELLDQLKVTFEEAERRGLGTIAYNFTDHATRSAIIKAFRDGRKAFEDTEGLDIPDQFRVKCDCGKDHTAELVPILATFAAFLFGARKYFADRRKFAKARLRETHSYESSEDGIQASFSTIAPKDI